ncbi:hypothetical protein TNCV_4398151 [Trichonephila clavipes]|nr:hypothetical protein TNCV_4398151 [Trichonephila clavipes]
MCGSLENGISCQVLPFSLGRGSKLRDPSAIALALSNSAMRINIHFPYSSTNIYVVAVFRGQGNGLSRMGFMTLSLAPLRTRRAKGLTYVKYIEVQASSHWFGVEARKGDAS